MNEQALDTESIMESPVETPTDSDVAIDVRGITVEYRAYNERPGTLKEIVLRYLKDRKSQYFTTFEALSDVNFTVNKGEIIGFIGSNGAGKSTLLKVLSGVLKPSRGEVISHGKVDSLISLGAGFDKELNAIENIYLYGSLHKVPREELAKRVPKILDFAELHEFAHTPIRYYSSGMYARLGFSCALDMDPDILLVDEVLAVGDERFRDKCYKAMDELLGNGRTIILVTHSISMIEKMAHKIGLLSKGRLVYFGDPKEAIQRYRDDRYETALDGNRLS